MNISFILIILLSYMVGSISGGVLIGKIRNVDIRKKGSKAAGATNAFRTMGTLFALSVLIIDVFFLTSCLSRSVDSLESIYSCE